MTRPAGGVAARVRGDRWMAYVAAFLAAAPLVAISVAMLVQFARFHLIPPLDASSLGFAYVTVAALTLGLAGVWVFVAVRSAMTPQRVQAIWLRRFSSEGKGRFATSRVIDNLSRRGISALTLQDRDVRLSWQQRRNRIGPSFVAIYAACVAAIAGYAFYTRWTWSQSGTQPFLGDLGLALASVAIGLVAALPALLVALAIGPIGALITRERDDFGKLPRILARVQHGKQRGATVVRVKNEHWQSAVTLGLGAVDVAVLDLTDVSESITWEFAQAMEIVGRSALVFICRTDELRSAHLPDAAKRAFEAAGAEPPRVADMVFYPPVKSKGRAFEAALTQAVYAAFDSRQR